MLPAASDNGRTDPRQLTPHSFPESAGGPEKDASDVASFAALCGVSPVECSSGRRQFRRLNRGGDRQANAALHRIVFTRLRVDPQHPGLLRAPHQGGQDPSRNRPLPQMLCGPGGLPPGQTATVRTLLIGAVTENALRDPRELARPRVRSRTAACYPFLATVAPGVAVERR
ncbi:transposase [Streptomyces sp. NBC_00365]|uniref:transposase n=1 Tax=Streptomyces sp. NBC_00365 TaxID=2975726 RepID=UPI00338EF0DF